MAQRRSTCIASYIARVHRRIIYRPSPRTQLQKKQFAQLTTNVRFASLYLADHVFDI